MPLCQCILVENVENVLTVTKGAGNMSVPLIVGIGVVGLVVFYFSRHILGGAFGLYKVVPVNEAHIRILQNSKMTFSARQGKSAYWVVPFITKLHKLPLCNLAIPVNDIKLKSKKGQTFRCKMN